MKPYAELLEFNQVNPIRQVGHTRIRDAYTGLRSNRCYDDASISGDWFTDPERIVEFAGRTDYGDKSLDKFGDPDIIQRWIKSKHETMIEMAHATFFIECSRVVSHELVRHRLASFQQESQRYVKYDEEDIEELFFDPTESPSAQRAYFYALEAYKELRDAGTPAQLARYVLPNGTRTRIVISANIREWRHIISLRLHTRAQPEMQELMQQVYDQLVMVFPRLMEGVLDNADTTR